MNFLLLKLFIYSSRTKSEPGKPSGGSCGGGLAAVIVALWEMRFGSCINTCKYTCTHSGNAIAYTESMNALIIKKKQSPNEVNDFCVADSGPVWSTLLHSVDRPVGRSVVRWGEAPTNRACNTSMV